MYTKFKKDIWSFYKCNKRDLPWRRTRDPYRILISEIMLQQTQVDRVIPRYLQFLTRFPTFASLAKAPLADVLKVWQGLGYNRRALSLKRLAHIVSTNYRGRLPKEVSELERLPGIGPYTARAICAFAWNQPNVCIETNIRRVYIHHFFPKKSEVHDEQLLPIIEKTIDQKNPREWFYALMDYGSVLGRAVTNPNRRSQHYALQSKFEGSRRQLRGAVLRLVLQHHKVPVRALPSTLKTSVKIIGQILGELEQEGFIQRQGGHILSS